ncbi:ArfGap domain-containing protein, partial [Cephalotus follicularis]
MKNRLKEDEKIEKMIRGFLKLPENRRCINCNMLGPQYVCTTFLTFVCTNCSGVHREFTHRVKSVSMAKFTTEEVNALQAGGNERARQIYFKEWDPQRHSYPDGSDLHRLRNFIKHVYVDRKYAGDQRSTARLPTLRLTDKEDSYDTKKAGAYLGGFRGAQVEEVYERCSSGRSYQGGRSEDGNVKFYYDESRTSPRFARENSRSGGFKRSPVRFEIVDDRLRDDRFGSGRRYETQRLSKEESKFVSNSPDRQMNLDRYMSPLTLPVKDTSGENVPKQKVGSSSRSPCTYQLSLLQNTESSSDMASVNSNQLENKGGNSESLLDLSTNTDPSNAIVAPQIQQDAPSNDGGNQSSNFSKEKTIQAPKMNTLEALLFELSPALVPVGIASEVPSSIEASSTAKAANIPAADILSAASAVKMSETPCKDNVSTFSSAIYSSAQPCNGGLPLTVPDNSGDTIVKVVSTIDAPEVPSSRGPPHEVPDNNRDSTVKVASTIDVLAEPSSRGSPQEMPDNNSDSTVKVFDRQQFPSILQHQPSASPATEDRSSPTQQAITPVGAPNNQTASLVPNAEAPFGAEGSSAQQPSQALSKPVQDTISAARAQPLQVDTKSSGRKELPEDIFTANYPSVSAPFQGWQTHPAHGMGFGMQRYPNTMPMPVFVNSAKSTNPFDLNSETSQLQAPPFPFMASLQGVLPNMSVPTVLLSAPSFDTQSSGFMTPQLASYAFAPHSQSPSFTSAPPTGPYMGQQERMNVPPS